MKYCHKNAEMQKRKFDDVTLQYSTEGKFLYLEIVSTQAVQISAAAKLLHNNRRVCDISSYKKKQYRAQK